MNDLKWEATEHKCHLPYFDYYHNNNVFKSICRRWGRPYVINFSVVNPMLLRYSTVEPGACDGALSCIKIIFFLNAGYLLRYQGVKLSWRKFRYVSAFILTASGNEPTSSSDPQAHLPCNYPIPKHNTTLLSSHILMVCYGSLEANLWTSYLVHRGLLCTHLWKERSGSLSWHTFWPIQVAEFRAWWWRESEYSVSQVWQLCWGSGNE